MNTVIHFEVHATDPNRVADFYNRVFGWDIKEWTIPGVELAKENRYWAVVTGSSTDDGINGGILFRHGDAPVDGQAVNSFICTIGVASVDASAEKILASGGSVVVGKMPVKGIGWLAYCKDTEGNIFGIMQEDKNAG